MTNERILLKRDGALAIVRFSNPGAMNAMDKVMCREFLQVMDEALDNQGIRAILLTGEGNAFCAGAQLKEMSALQSAGETPDVGESLSRYINPVLVRMVEGPKPIVAAVNGAAVGVGCGIALAADIVLVGRSGYFLQSFVRLGVVPDGGSTWSLPRLAGRGRAAAAMMLGDRIDAETAIRWGLAYRVFEDAALPDAARQIGQRLAQGPTLALGRIKDLLSRSEDSKLEAQLALETDHQRAAFASQDCREGIAAFVEKRAPVFHGE